MLADAYNTANKLVGVTKGTSSIVYAYSGLGDRLRQIADGVTTDYTLDINAGLTQVLQDGKQSYLYGNSRIAQIAETQTGYFLPDALGSVRQIETEATDLQLTRSYDPSGNVIFESGNTYTAYGYVGEMQNTQNNLINMRARQFNTITSLFLTKDIWDGNNYLPISYNKYIYANSNPINLFDPSGMCSQQNWDDPEGGLFSESECDRLEHEYHNYEKGMDPDITIFTSWYRRLADRIDQDGHKQIATNLRHFLNNSGQPLQLSSDFVKNEVYGWNYLKNEIGQLINWYSYSKYLSCEENSLITADQDVFTRPVLLAPNFSPEYLKILFGNWPSSDLYGSLGSFRIDIRFSGVAIRNGLDFKQAIHAHLVVLDFYNWHIGQAVSYDYPFIGKSIPDDWAALIEEKNAGKNYFIRGDFDIPDINNGGLGFPSVMPNWKKVDCIGSGFQDKNNYPSELTGLGFPYGSCAPGPF